MSRISETMTPNVYGDLPGYKEQTTSRDAAIAFNKPARTLRALVYRTIGASGPAGRTADEVATGVDRSPFAVRPRLSELARMEPPMIRHTGERRKNSSGIFAAVWRVA